MMIQDDQASVSLSSPCSSRTVCPVCIDEMSPSKVFICPFCDYLTCRACVSKFTLVSKDEPKCMSCNRVFDRDILCKVSNKFVNVDLKKHREDVLLEREMSMMPSTQIYVEHELARRERNATYKSLMAERQSLLRRVKSIDELCRDLSRMNYAAEFLDLRNEERRQFIHKCSQSTCEGFLSSSWKCGVCKMYTCCNCNAPLSETKEDGHVCLPADVETMKLLKADCKKCPGCAQFIHKVSGCDQMWCTSCHTAFSWKTGLKVQGTIHNPHFYDFQRQNYGRGRNLNDIPCGGMPTLREMNSCLRAVASPPDVVQFFNSVHRLTNHLSEVVLPMYPYNENVEDANRDLRVNFMIGDLTSEALKIKLQQREKRREKKRDIHFILEMIVTTMTDLLRQSLMHTDFHIKMGIIKSLFAYGNESLSKVSLRFSCVVPVVYPNEEKVVTRKYVK